MPEYTPDRYHYDSTGCSSMDPEPNGEWVRHEDIERFLPRAGNHLPTGATAVLAKIVSNGDEAGSWYHCVCIPGTNGASWLRRDMKILDLSKVIAWMHAP